MHRLLLQSSKYDPLPPPGVSKTTSTTASNENEQGRTAPKNPPPPASFRILILAFLVLQNTLTALLGRFTRQENDKKDLYSIGEFILVSEFLKLIVSILFELMTGSENLPHNSSGSSSSRLEEFKVRLCHNPRDLFRMSVPAVCYWASNTLLYMAISNLSVPIFQVMSQSKLVITAVLSVLVLKRHYSSRQWACLVIISISLALITLEEKNAADISTPARTGSNGQFISGLFAMSFSITVNGPAKRKVAEKLLRVY